MPFVMVIATIAVCGSVTIMRLIDADVIPWEEYYVPDPDSNVQWDYKKELSVLKPDIDQMPTIDAVEVVRCRACKYSDYAFDKYWCEYFWNKYKSTPSSYEVKADGFCNNGERKEK